MNNRELSKKVASLWLRKSSDDLKWGVSKLTEVNETLIDIAMVWNRRSDSDSLVHTHKGISASIQELSEIAEKVQKLLQDLKKVKPNG